MMIKFQETTGLWRIPCTSIYPVTLKEVVNVYDLGYLEVEKDFPEQQYHHCLTGRGKIMNYSPKKKNTTKVILKENSDIAYTIICRLKKYRIMSDVFRNRLGKYNGMSYIVSGLVNYRIMNHYRY
jgi:hypothetical protein